MKWIAFAVILIAAPLIGAWLRTNPRNAPWLWALLTLLPFVQGPWHLEIAPYSTPTWSGYVKGWELSLLDAVAFGILFGTRGRWPRLSLFIPFMAYFVVVLLTALMAAKFPNLALSYVVQLLRVGLVFLAVARVAAMERGERALLIGLVLGLTVQAGYALWARANGALQTGGSLGHQNLLGFVSHMALLPAFALLLSGKMPRWALLGVASGLIVAILTASRATIAIAGAGLVLTLFLSIASRFTPRKAAIAVAGLALLAVSFPLAYATLERRFAVQNTTFLSEDKERLAFEKAAHDMTSVYPFGVGPNHYVFIANTEGFSERAGVAWNTGSRSTNVHNSYLLIRAETGLLGLVTFVLLLGAAIVHALSGAFRYKKMAGSEVLIGFGMGLVAVLLHGLVEWMFVINPIQYVLAGSLGFVAGMNSRFRAELRSRGRRQRQEAPKAHSEARSPGSYSVA